MQKKKTSFFEGIRTVSAVVKNHHIMLLKKLNPSVGLSKGFIGILKACIQLESRAEENVGVL